MQSKITVLLKKAKYAVSLSQQFLVKTLLVFNETSKKVYHNTVYSDINFFVENEIACSVFRIIYRRKSFLISLGSQALP